MGMEQHNFNVGKLACSGAMKRLAYAIILLAAIAFQCAAQPIQRNSFSTNRDPILGQPNLLSVACWGDSLTLGGNGGYPLYMMNYNPSLITTNMGDGAETSIAIAARCLNATNDAFTNWNYFIWAGNNDDNFWLATFPDTAITNQIMTNTINMVNHLRDTNRFLVFGLLHHWWVQSTNAYAVEYRIHTNFNQMLRSYFGDNHYVDPLSILQAGATNAQEFGWTNAGTYPFRFCIDSNVHLTAQGYAMIATNVSDRLAQLIPGLGGETIQGNERFFSSMRTQQIDATYITSGKLGLGGVAASDYLQVYAPKLGPTNGMTLEDTSTEATGVGGALFFKGAYTGTTTTGAAKIEAYKENSTDGDYSFSLVFGTRSNTVSPGPNQKMWLTSGGRLGLGISTPISKLHVQGIKAAPNNLLTLDDTNAVALGVGGAINLRGYFDGSTITSGVLIEAYKEDAVSGNYDFGLRIGTRKTGAGSVTTPALFLSGSGGDLSLSNRLFVAAVTNGVAPPSRVLQPIGLFGSMMFSLATNTVTIGSAGTYYALTNYSVARTNGFGANLATGFLTNTVAGYYRVTVYASMIGGASDTLEGETFLNETGKEEISLFGSYDNPARVRTMSSTGILYIPANTGISFRLNNRSDTDNITVWRAAITVGTP